MISRLVVDHIVYLAAISSLGNSLKSAVDHLLILVKLRPDSFFNEIILYCIVVYKKLNAERSKLPENSRGNFSKDIFRGIPEREFPVALVILNGSL